MKRRFLSLLLVLTTAVSLCACGSTADTSASVASSEPVSSESSSVSEAEPEPAEELSYEEESALIYENALGEYYAAYQEADAEEAVSRRYALMAVAEAKLMESAVMLPLYTVGGRYAISRVAPYTFDYVLWGSDYQRYHQALVCTELLKTEDRSEMKEKWGELKGTGTYEEWAKDYLAGKGYTLKDTYTLVYTADPTTWDCLSSSLMIDSSGAINTFDGLLEYDVEGVLQPALAESYTISEDGLTYTFKIREGVKWVDSQGRIVADVCADDFVAGMQHMLDAQGGLEYLIEGVIQNVSQYIAGDVTDFSEVGVRAVDDLTLEYTLEEPCSYFLTMLGYSIFAPMSRSFYVSQGGKFGAEYDTTAADYTYGKSPDSIAYCGPYLVTNATEKNTIVFKQNESYWNKDHINIKTIVWLYDEGSDVTKIYNDVISGVVDGCSLTASTIELAREDDLFDDYSYVSATDATSYMAFYNLNRGSFANYNDATVAVSTQTEEDAARTKAAMNNVHFRRAISFAVDRGSYNAQMVGEELKNCSLRNSYTPANFVSLAEDVTIDINGAATTFAAGTFYGEIMQAQIDADGVPIKVWDPDADDGIGSGDGYDGWYNTESAVAELEAAIAELADEGIVVDESNPIVFDVPYPSEREVNVNKVNAYKQSVEKTLGGKVIVNLVDTGNLDGWYWAGYYTGYGYENNYDMYDLSGWAPDYGDPSSYLGTVLPDYAGYMTRCFGIY